MDTKVKLQSIAWTDTTVALEITGAQYTESIGTLAKINGGVYDAHITDLSADVTMTAESDANISEFSVKDNAANLAKNLSALQASASAGTVKIQGITLDGTDAVAITAASYGASTDALVMMDTSSIKLTVSDVSAAEVANVFADTQVTSFTVKDTAANIVAKLGDLTTPGDLDTAVANITGLTVSDANVLNLTGAQYADNVVTGGVLAKLGTYQAAVTDLAASHTADATTDDNVVTFTVLDDAAGITSNFSDLVSAGLVSAGNKLTLITQSDTDPITIPLSDLVTDAQAYADTLNKFAVKPTVALT